jgi:hypothetical protein
VAGKVVGGIEHELGHRVMAVRAIVWNRDFAIRRYLALYIQMGGDTEDRHSLRKRPFLSGRTNAVVSARQG